MHLIAALEMNVIFKKDDDYNDFSHHKDGFKTGYYIDLVLLGSLEEQINILKSENDKLLEEIEGIFLLYILKTLLVLKTKEWEYKTMIGENFWSKSPNKTHVEKKDEELESFEEKLRVLLKERDGILWYAIHYLTYLDFKYELAKLNPNAITYKAVANPLQTALINYLTSMDVIKSREVEEVMRSIDRGDFTSKDPYFDS